MGSEGDSAQEDFHLRHYLAACPHPAFILAAVPIFAALHARESLSARDTGFGARRAQSQDSAEQQPSLAALDNNRSGDVSHQVETASRYDRSMSRSGTGSFKSPAAHQDRILASGFTRNSSPAPDWLHVDQQKGERAERTAEGAVEAMYKAKAADEQRRELDQEDRARSEERTNEASEASASDTKPKPWSLSKVLHPLWANQAYRGLFQDANDAGDLLQLLSVDHLQALLRLLAAAVSGMAESTTKRSSNDDQAETVRFNNPSGGKSAPARTFRLTAVHLGPSVVVTSMPVDESPPLARAKSGRLRTMSHVKQSHPSVHVPETPVVMASKESAARSFSILPEGVQLDLQREFVTEKSSKRRARKERTLEQVESIQDDDDARGAMSQGTPDSEISEPVLTEFKGSTSTSDTLTPISPSAPPLGLPPTSELSSAESPLNDRFIAQLQSSATGQLVLEFPWHETSLGPLASWSAEIRTMVSLTLACPYRACAWIGQDLTLIYNDAYAGMAGEKHPDLLGVKGAIGWSELWTDVGALANRCLQGETIAAEDQMLTMFRHGFLEETYHTWSWIPFRDSGGEVAGFFNVALETTARVIAERRLATIRDVVLASSNVQTLPKLCANVLDSLAKNPYDLPFAMLYTCESVSKTAAKRAEVINASADGHALVQLTRMGTIGVPAGHSSAPEKVVVQVEQHVPDDSKDDTESSSMQSMYQSQSTGKEGSSDEIWPFSLACSSRKPVFVEDLRDRAKGFMPRGWLDPAKHAVVIPIAIDSADSPTLSGVLIVGLNPRRPWNEIFAAFLHLLSRQVAAGFLAVTNAERDQRKVEELAALNKARATFAQNINHELRTPLQLILGPLDDMLHNRQLAARDRTTLTTVKRNADRLLGMVNTVSPSAHPYCVLAYPCDQLLDFSEVESGQSKHTFRPTDLSALTSDLASLFRSAIESGGLDFVVSCQPSDEVHDVYTSPELYEKVVFNLLSNAFKYTSKGSVEVSVQYTTDEAILQVRDSGCGIPEAELKNIFDRFHRVNSTARTHEGTGIGLALTYEVVKALGARLSVESELNVGSTFTIHLPRGTAHLHANRVEHDPAAADAQYDSQQSARARSSLAAIEAASSLHTPEEQEDALTPGVDSHSVEYDLSTDLLNIRHSTIVLADDNSDLRQYIMSILSKVYTVKAFENGQSAFEYICEHPPALVLTDVMMGKMDGNELLRAIRAHPKLNLIPVIFLTAQGGEERRSEALEAGVDDILPKPFSSRELLARVNVHLQLGKMRGELEKRVIERTKELGASEIRYRTLADRYSTLSMLSPVGIFMTDEAGVISYTNPRFSEIAGLSEGASPTTWIDNVDKNDRKRVEDSWYAAVSQDMSSEVSNARLVEFRWRNGNYALLEIQPFEEGTAKRGFVGAFTDITVIKALEVKHIKSVEARAQDAEQARQALEALIDLTSHELRNPVSAVINSAEVLRGSMVKLSTFLEHLQSGEAVDQEVLQDIMRETAEDSESVEAIALSAAHQAAIASDILNVSKLHLGLLTIQPVPFSLPVKMREVLKMFDIECSHKQIALSLDMHPSVAELQANWINADPVRVSQVVLNFITNAVKFTVNSAQRRISVQVHAYTQIPPLSPSSRRVGDAQPPDTGTEDRVWISLGVQDTGRGLAPDELDKLFARFVQARPRSDQYLGSGLGLHVALLLVKLQSGFIEVESEPDRGSTFRFVIPVTRAQPPAQTASTRVTLPLKASGDVSDDDRSSTRSEHLLQHILIVEDNIINQRVLSRQLRQLGLSVVVANHGQEGIEALQADKDGQIDVVLADVEMPIMNGLDMAREACRLQKEGQLRKYPLVAVTGNARQGQLDECMAAGFKSTVTKPYNLRELVATMETLTSKRIGGTA